MSYTIKKFGSIYQVICGNNLVQFSSLERANCSRWIAHVNENQDDREKRFLNSQ